MNEQRTHQRVALVTGANQGIGRGAARQLAELGMTVLVGAGHPERGEEMRPRCATDSNAHTGLLPVARGAAVLVRLAPLDGDGPTAGFFDDEGPVPW